MTLRHVILLVCLVQLALSAVMIQKRDATTGLRAGCFPRPSSAGCRCAEKDKVGNEVTKLYETAADCTLKHDPQQIENKKTMLDELKTDVAGLKDGCYPRASNIGCRCTEKDTTGHDVAKIYETDADCRKDAEPLERRRRDVETEQHHEGDGHDHAKGEPVGAKVRPAGAAAGDGASRRVRRGDANISAEEAAHVSEASVSTDDVKPEEIHEKATAVETPVGGPLMPAEVAKAAAGGAAVTDESDRVPRHDGKPHHHEGDGHDHSKGEPVGANVRPAGAAAGEGAAQRVRRNVADAAAVPAGGADATAREAAGGAASGGSLRPNVYPKPDERPYVPAIQSEQEAKAMGDVAEHMEESARRKREAVQPQPRDRPFTAGAGVHEAKHQHADVDQNVRDPVREKAAQNYQAVLNELKDKFRGLKEGCYPRPKGCLCVIGKNDDGRDRTERRMKEADCKCQPGETGAGCPPGA